MIHPNKCPNSNHIFLKSHLLNRTQVCPMLLLYSLFIHSFQPVTPLLAGGLHSCLHACRSCATRIHVLPAFSSMSSLHLRLGLPFVLFPSLGVYSVVFLAHLLLFILARCLARSALLMISFTCVFDLTSLFLILFLSDVQH